MKLDYYFTLELTESEHGVVEMMIRKECLSRGIDVLYYRPFKTGHVSCQRECKINCPPKVGKEILKKLDIEPRNYWVDNKRL